MQQAIILDNGADRAFRLFLIPVKPAVALGEAGQHDDFTGDVGVGVITVAEGYDKSQPSGCLLEQRSEPINTLVKQQERQSQQEKQTTRYHPCNA
ncbi:hypothetical protein DMS26_23385 [Klebsiella variicola]|nr:hypothetical protein DMS26_23385 [Klebsiella variicola]